MWLAGDIGGTKTRLALFEFKQHKEVLATTIVTFRSHNYAQLELLIEEYLSSLPLNVRQNIQAASFAIAGPVKEGLGHTTNLPWSVSAKVIATYCKIPTVFLLNDLEANAYALDVISKDKIFTLQAGKSILGNRAIVSPGTGLGEAGIFWNGKKYHPFATEGGHVDFGPTDALQQELCTYLIQRFGHASYERVLSGPGIHNLYQFLVDVKKQKDLPEVTERLKKEDPAAVISHYALEKTSSVCQEALKLFATILGAEAGNCALKYLTFGGIYLGGGIPPKILPFLKGPEFQKGFLAKGRFHDFLSEIPVYVILEETAALMGAAHHCFQHLGNSLVS